MPALFIFLLKVNAALLLFCAGYYLVLRHLTFYTLNRVYLVGAIVFATAYPKINLSAFAERHQQIAKPVQTIISNWQAPAAALVKPITKPDYWYWVEVVFWVGVVLLAMRLAMQLYSLYKLYRNSTAAQIYDHDVRLINSDSGPFSFWKSIYVNPANLDPDALKSILQHEQIHVSEWHTVDVLIAELSTIFYWFNPGVWLMKKAVKENIEFITDRKILKNGTDTRQYQYSLVSVSFATSANTIVNHFNISTIKKRIIMMNAKRSSKIKLTRYAFLVPAVLAMLLVFSISKAELVKKNFHITKALAFITNKTVAKHTAPAIITKPVIIQKTANKAVAVKVVQPIAAKLQDTLRNGSVLISSTDHFDSINFVINGVRSNKAGFKALDPDKIHSIDMVAPEQAAKIVDHLDPKHGTVFVTTDDSETGRKFKEKVDGLSRNFSATINRPDYNNEKFRIKDTGSNTATMNSIVLAKTNSSDNDSDSESMNASPSTVANVIFIGRAPQKQHLTLTNTGKGKIDTLKLNQSNFKVVTSNVRFVKRAPLTLEARGNDSTSQVYAITVNNVSRTEAYKKFTPLKRSAFTNLSSHNSQTNINHLSTKMVMIDGKEVTEREMKKLSVADIESINVESGDDVLKKYGEKAKNGVLFITTKK
jgi:bla regulator protein BlaR1